MNGKEYKKEIERIIKIARNVYPDIKDDMLEENGAIYYANGNDGTDFDWNVNNKLCEFLVYHKNGWGFIKVCVYKSNDINVYIYKGKRDLAPTYEFKDSLMIGESKDFAKLMFHISDYYEKYDEIIDKLNWDVDTNEYEDIDNLFDEDEDC